ncbi:MAG: ATP-binding cassette domain-containing protein [Acidimicrobiaceae bacterium]|nr:ATP-binding cassette domain-containing protein [Acidimicrobiaceae bacterium]
MALRIEKLLVNPSIKAVDDINFEIERGEICALLGPNGADKTTSIEVFEGNNIDVLGCQFTGPCNVFGPVGLGNRAMNPTNPRQRQITKFSRIRRKS